MLKHIKPYLPEILLTILDHLLKWFFARPIELPPPALLYVADLVQSIGLV